MPSLNLVSDNDSMDTQQDHIDNTVHNDVENMNKDNIYQNGCYSTKNCTIDNVQSRLLLPSEDQLSEAFLFYVNVSRLLCS